MRGSTGADSSPISVKLPINVPYHAAVQRSRLARRRYSSEIERIAARPITPPRVLDFDVYSFSGEGELPEQVASIRSFLRYAGAPTRFMVVSDGSHRPRSLELLEQLHPCVTPVPLEEMASGSLPDGVRAYAKQHPLGQKLSLLISLRITRPTIYVDSDVLFFDGAMKIAEPRLRARGSLFFLVDCRPSLDDRLLDVDGSLGRSVNSGFLILNRQPDWAPGLERLATLEGDPNFFTEQTVVHLVMHANGALPLDQSKFVVGIADQFQFRDAYTRTAPALRHYVRPVRYRLWTNLRSAGCR
jgi:hypothetical protein